MGKYHSRIMNTKTDPSIEELPVRTRLIFKDGFKHARHEAAEIALEAESVINNLVEALEKTKRELEEIAEEDGYDPYNSPLVNDALAKAKGDTNR